MPPLPENIALFVDIVEGADLSQPCGGIRAHDIHGSAFYLVARAEVILCEKASVFGW
jgi:hypothetical protein